MLRQLDDWKYKNSSEQCKNNVLYVDNKMLLVWHGPFCYRFKINCNPLRHRLRFSGVLSQNQRRSQWSHKLSDRRFRRYNKYVKTYWSKNGRVRHDGISCGIFENGNGRRSVISEVSDMITIAPVVASGRLKVRYGVSDIEKSAHSTKTIDLKLFSRSLGRNTKTPP